MLARAHRIVHGDDYKSVVRRGKRAGTPHLMIYSTVREAAGPARFGFIVSKAVGNAVVRNTVRRRLKSIALEMLPAISPGVDVVVRARPEAAQASWVTLRAEISPVVNKGLASV